MSVIKCIVVLCVAIAATNGFALGPTQIVFHLYTRSNPELSQPLLPSEASIMNSSFQRSKRTIITIHNHRQSVGGNFNAFVIPAHLGAEDVNVIAVDWSPGASSYTFALSNVPQVGNVIAQFVNILTNFGYSTENIRIVGVGLGAHAAGIAARRIQGTIPHVVALDPSLIGWTHHPDILNKNDANIVEVIHTTSGVYGYDKPLGDIDFYPNGGTVQTGCGTDTTCSHTYAYVFYAESITAEAANGNKFVGTACESLEEASTLRCTGEKNAIFGGTNTKTSGSGIYLFLTNIQPPFARG
ncbi:pancreatic triacylglycerol lipase-like [Nymphalis io]|uniref:pancreatic triacylglycerol lipase-like n=1 Tax=Inachis io TaxID=171585 RepID=UPI002167F100|nr:pancreatic triacylglycerol lipase-like [Nymphalis io]